MDIVSESDFLKSYDISKFNRPSVTVDIVTFGVWGEEGETYRKDEKKTISLLLVKRGEHPFKNKWALPGGFLRNQETVEESAFREIKEETGVLPRSLMPIGTFSEKGRDPRGWIISNAFVSVISEDGVKASAGDDAQDAKWFKCSFQQMSSEENLFKLELVSEDETLTAILEKVRFQFGRTEFKIIESNDLAFDHALIISTAFDILRHVAEDFDVIFDFLPEKFTLTGLQKVQETILGVSLLPANFRRKVEKYVQETDEFTSGMGHRPAKLFTKRKK